LLPCCYQGANYSEEPPIRGEMILDDWVAGGGGEKLDIKRQVISYFLIIKSPIKQIKP